MPNIHIFSPHIDDAFLSLGGCIMNWRAQQMNVKVYNLFTITHWTTSGCISGLTYTRDVNTITVLRKAEEREVASFAQFEFEFWDFPDMPLRVTHVEKEAMNMEEEIASRIEAHLNPNDFFFFPLGILHFDHLLVRQISNRFLNKKFNIFYFEDMPYFGWAGVDYQNLYKLEIQTKLPCIERININNKIEVLRNYRSQICDKWLSAIMAYSYNCRDNEYYERYWKVKIDR